MHKFFAWQFVSYLFIQPISEGVSLGSILRLLFDLYLLYMVGTAIIETRGKKHFIGLYFGGALFVGIVAYLSLLFSGSPFPFAGASPAIYILLISFVFLTPHARIMLFLMVPMQAKWLVFGLIGVNLFLDFSNGHFLSFFTTGAALVYGYLYPILVWEILSPFYRLHNIEKKMIYWKRKVSNHLSKSSLTLREK
ncbi:rhomboid family intramembrane serine protease [Candidatus Neptunochlamydia vexilliferae]|uniref:rhomboid family intramembrane serine protease n=1 Tax=Candidatus Neptunichlamydia vexilliferae TaxID=1651774 RepID=UPI001890BFCC|nr:rhomboid family intramembrane serine protease [Candidatus Neptunochlamydia vexilliferae]